MPQVQRSAAFAFGSAIRDDFRAGESDVDLLVESAPIGGHANFHAKQSQCWLDFGLKDSSVYQMAGK